MFDKLRSQVESAAQKSKETLKKVSSEVQKEAGNLQKKAENLQKSQQYKDVIGKFHRAKDRIDEKLKAEKSQIDARSNIHNAQAPKKPKKSASEMFYDIRDNVLAKNVDKLGNKVANAGKNAWETVRNAADSAKNATKNVKFEDVNPMPTFKEKIAKPVVENTQHLKKNTEEALSRVLNAPRNLVKGTLALGAGTIVACIFAYGIASNIPNAVAQYQVEKLRIQQKQLLQIQQNQGQTAQQNTPNITQTAPIAPQLTTGSTGANETQAQ